MNYFLNQAHTPLFEYDYEDNRMHRQLKTSNSLQRNLPIEDMITPTK